MDTDAAKTVHDEATLKAFLLYHKKLVAAGIVSRDIEHVAVDANFKIVLVRYKT
jgi:hypothetical protein